MLRPFNPELDREASRRIWRETGWLQPGKEDVVDRWVDEGRAMVCEVNGEAECLACTAPGTLAYQNELLPATLVTGVSTSRVARKQGHASRATARAVAEDVSDGAIVAALCMFDQGYYNQIGFGTGAYETTIAFDPALLIVKRQFRTPLRLTLNDFEIVHASRLNRPIRHGQCSVTPSVGSWGHMREASNGFGLGYRDSETGALTHHFWCRAKGERGPYEIDWMVYHNKDQFRELMSVIQSIGDQVRIVKMREPAEVQMQDLMRQPFKQMQVSKGSEFAAGIATKAAFQYRICDLPACLTHTHLVAPDLKFNVEISDNIHHFLEDSIPWRGIGGTYVVTLGAESHAEPGSDPALPMLKTTVGAFTRLWLGVRPATGLALTDHLDAPDELLSKLDETLRLPVPRNDWDY